MFAAAFEAYKHDTFDSITFMLQLLNKIHTVVFSSFSNKLRLTLNIFVMKSSNPACSAVKPTAKISLRNISKLNQPPIFLGAAFPFTRIITSFMVAVISNDKSDTVTGPRPTRFNIAVAFTSRLLFIPTVKARWYGLAIVFSECGAGNAEFKFISADCLSNTSTGSLLIGSYKYAGTIFLCVSFVKRDLAFRDFKVCDLVSEFLRRILCPCMWLLMPWLRFAFVLYSPSLKTFSSRAS